MYSGAASIYIADNVIDTKFKNWFSVGASQAHVYVNDKLTCSPDQTSVR